MSTLKNRPQLASMSLLELKDIMKSWQQPAYRAKQILTWCNKAVLSPENMNNLPAELQVRLSQDLDCQPISLVQRLISTDGTRKYLFSLGSGKTFETVFIPDAERGTVCVSSQVGCVLDCPFCYTGTQKFEANLSASEIVAQVLAVKADIADTVTGVPAQRVTNVVYMGMGEPLANEEGVHASLVKLLDIDGLALSRRKVTVSTSGLVPQIERLGKATPVSLAISLHSAIDEVRDKLVPINKKYPLQVLRACLNRYALAKQRHITLEYVMLAGVNDRPVDIDALANFANRERERVNLISFNPYPGNPYVGSSGATMDHFANALIKRGIRATVRRSRGQDIMAACGQLKATES
ncbi:MAG: 23S rRNA (adenine(2503)-C(2))-methyltransferase RlmN [Mariprofundaceae bacterium]